MKTHKEDNRRDVQSQMMDVRTFFEGAKWYREQSELVMKNTDFKQ